MSESPHPPRDDVLLAWFQVWEATGVVPMELLMHLARNRDCLLVALIGNEVYRQVILPHRYRTALR
jgi:hypothetical protein